MQQSGKLVIIGIVGVAARRGRCELVVPLLTPLTELFDFGVPRRLDLFAMPRSSSFSNMVAYQHDEYQKLALNDRDISNAPGLLHLRNALLEDRSFKWPAEYVDPDASWRWALVFRNQSGDTATLLSRERLAIRRYASTDEYILSCEPIAAGLREISSTSCRLPQANQR